MSIAEASLSRMNGGIHPCHPPAEPALDLIGGGGPGKSRRLWIPACAGMTKGSRLPLCARLALAQTCPTPRARHADGPPNAKYRVWEPDASVSMAPSQYRACLSKLIGQEQKRHAETQTRGSHRVQYIYCTRPTMKSSRNSRLCGVTGHLTAPHPVCRGRAFMPCCGIYTTVVGWVLNPRVTCARYHPLDFTHPGGEADHKPVVFSGVRGRGRAAS